MPPNGVDQGYVNLTKRFAAAKPAVNFVMQDDVVTKPNHGVAWVAFGKGAADNHIAWLNGLEANLVKSVGCHILQVEVFPSHPPTVSAFEFRQVDTTQVIGIPEKCVTIHRTMLEPAP